MLARYLAQYLDKTYIHINEYTDNLDNCVLHVHSVELAKKYNNYQILLIKRSPVEIAASIMIANITSTFHFSRDDSDLINTVKREDYIKQYENTQFEIDIVEYLKMVQYFIDWYISAEDIMKNSIQFLYHEAININAINYKLNLKKIPTDDFSLPLSQPWNKWDKIKDGQTIKAAGDKLLLPYIKRHKNIFA